MKRERIEELRSYILEELEHMECGSFPKQKKMYEGFLVMTTELLSMENNK